LAGTGLIGIIGVARADEPMRLSESQMDQVNAANGVMMTINGVQASIEKNGTVTVNGILIKNFTNLVVESRDYRLSVAQGNNLRVLTTNDVPDVTNSVLEAGDIRLSVGRAEIVRVEPK
jgi:hypothetical protein